jgi:hypothetical protein
MTDRAPSLLRRLFGARAIVVERVTPEALALRYGRTQTLFDRASSQILQNGKLVGMLGSVQRIELHRPPNQEGTVNWFVTVHLSGARQVEVGQVSDTTDASAIGACIATVTGRPVVVQS